MSNCVPSFLTAEYCPTGASQLAPVAKSCLPMQEAQETWVQSLGWENPLENPGEGHGNPLQCSCLENPKDRGGWQATATGSQRVRQTIVTWHATYQCANISLGNLTKEHVVGHFAH